MPYKAGQNVIVKIGGVPTEATIRAVIDHTDGLYLIVDFGPRTGCDRSRKGRGLE